MKPILLVVGAVSLLASPALAGTAKKTREHKTVASAEARTAKPAVEVAAPIAAVVVADAAAGEVAAPSPEVIAIPELPADTSSALVPFPELENARPLIAPVAKPVKAKGAKAPVMKFGNDYTLGAKREQVTISRDVEQIVLKGLSQAQVATVVQGRMDEIQVCWNAVPKTQRPDACTADLKLSISETGQVTDIELGGDVPAGAHKCITSAVSRWSFPVAETSSDVEYGISLRSL